MYYYQAGEEEFFEQKRFDNEHRPTYGDIEFMKKKACIKELKFTWGNSSEEITEEEWEKLKKVIYPQENEKPIPNLRDHAVSLQPLFQEYVNNGNIRTFEDFEYRNGENLLEAMKHVNLDQHSSLYEFFTRGENIGNCGQTSKLVGIMFDNVEYHRSGKAPFLVGTEGCSEEKQSHAWIETIIDGKKYVIDTSLLMVIPEELKQELGYQDISRPLNLNELLEFDDQSEVMYTHYMISPKYSVENKPSYMQYRDYEKEYDKTHDDRDR